ncbi:L-alanine-DL-glutamate epimerase-like enolase superfamily enzyme [Bradyrhizobium liaoningense]
MTDSFTIRSIEAFCYRYPLAVPVVTSFGKMLNRPAVFVRAVDEDGVEGWGEACATFQRQARSIAPGSSTRCLRPRSSGANSMVPLRLSRP